MNNRSETLDYATASNDAAQELIKELQEENIRLKRRLWRLRLSSTLTIGLSLIGFGGASLIGSYFTNSVILTLSGLGLVFWGVVMLYISPQRYVPESVFGSLALSMTRSIDKLVASLNYGGRTIFLHPKLLKGLSQGYVFIPFENNDQNLLPNDESLAEEKFVYENPRGIFMIAPSQGLVQLMETEMDTNLAATDMAYVKEHLPKLLVNNLRIIDSMAIEENRGYVRVIMEGEAAAIMCKAVGKETSIGKHFGCPLCSSLGLIISKVTGKPVRIEENKVDDLENTITTTFRTLEI